MAHTSSNSAGAVRIPPAGPTAPQAAAAPLSDIKGPVVFPSSWAWAGWLLAAALVALATWLALRAWRRRRQHPPAVVVVPAHVRARDRLRAALEWIGQPNPFCTEVSLTLRIYLEERFRLRAPEQTTEEFLDQLQSSPHLARSQKQALADFLVRCDLVKFARHEPAEAELRELWDAAERLVAETVPGENRASSPPAVDPGNRELPPQYQPSPSG